LIVQTAPKLAKRCGSLGCRKNLCEIDFFIVGRDAFRLVHGLGFERSENQLRLLKLLSFDVCKIERAIKDADCVFLYHARHAVPRRTPESISNKIPEPKPESRMILLPPQDITARNGVSSLLKDGS
jgi:hypothetical protein